jgi:hypothetical protein
MIIIIKIIGAIKIIYIYNIASESLVVCVCRQVCLERWARQRSVINGQVHAPLHLFPATEALFAKIEMRKIMKKKETGKRKETR